MKKKLQHFWSNANGFSIVDLLALTFTLTYLLSILTIMAVGDSGSVRQSALDTLTQPMLIILGGYFVDQSVSRFTTKKNSESEPVSEDDI